MHFNYYKIIYWINNFLGIIILGLCVYILGAPFLPELLLPINEHIDKSGGYVYTTNLKPEKPSKPIPKTNRLVIPKIRVDGEITSGNSESALAKGIWHNLVASSPDRGGNSVFIAHRRLYTSGPNTFYHLPKMKVGDKFIIYWEGKEYDYEVYETKTVPPNAVEIEENTKEPIVTLYTCTPLFTSSKRFVVRAKLINPEVLIK